MKYAYMNGKILDGSENMEPVEGKVILTDGDKIVDIVDKGTDLTGYKTVSLLNYYIMPGLINLHVHLPGDGKPKKKKKDPVKQVKFFTMNAGMRSIAQAKCETNIVFQLNGGVTTIRTMGGIRNFDTKIRDRILNDKIQGPRVLAANMAISVPGGHMAGSLAYEATSSEAVVDYVRKLAEQKVDLIKLMVTGGVLDATKEGEPGEVKMPAPYVKAACDEAHKLGLKVAAHAESPEGVKIALENGVDTIEHGAKPDDEMIGLFKKTGASLVATLSPALPYALFDRSVSNITDVEQHNGKIVFDGIIECAKACLENGIPVGLGTDTGCPYVTHYDMWREINYFHKFCGVSNAFALYTATKRNAEIAGIGDLTGSIEPGKCADLLVTKENPLEDLTTLRDPVSVIAKGKIFNQLRFLKYQNVEDELDKFI